MRTRLFSSLIAIFIVILISNSSFQPVQAQDTQPPADPASENTPPKAKVMDTFVYQGILKENGVPVNGVRSMRFEIWQPYSDSDPGEGWYCTDGGTKINYTNPAQDVTVKNGLFSVKPTFQFDIKADIASGRKLFIKVFVNETPITCDLLYPVPYALGLVPGSATIFDIPGSAEFTAANINSTQANSNGLQGEATAPSSAGVKGINNVEGGYAIHGKSTAGVAVYAEGSIKSTKDSVLTLSPHSMQVRYPTTDIALRPLENGGMSILNNGSAGVKYVTIPISAFSSLFGSPLYAKSLYVCYAGTSTSNAYIDATQVLKNDGSTSYTVMISNSMTHRDSQTHDCYSISTVTPSILDNSAWVQFNVYLGTGQWLDIYTTQLTLTETP
jgi:hypothetical protein